MPSNARSVNSTIFTGRLSRDSELVKGEDGRADFIAFELVWRNYAGGKIIGTTRLDCRAYRYQMDKCRRLQKGDEVRVTGELRSAQGEDGQKIHHLIVAGMWELQVREETEHIGVGEAPAASSLVL